MDLLEFEKEAKIRLKLASRMLRTGHPLLREFIELEKKNKELTRRVSGFTKAFDSVRSCRERVDGLISSLDVHRRMLDSAGAAVGMRAKDVLFQIQSSLSDLRLVLRSVDR